MMSINLIDWRTQRILILNRRFAFVTSAAVLISLLLSGFIYLCIQSQISTGNSDMTYLESELTAVSGALNEIKGLQTQKNILLSRRKTIESLQESRTLVVRMFDNLVRAIPDGVVLRDLQRKDDTLTMNGTSDSNYSISVFMENIQRLPWVAEAKLGEIKGSSAGAQNSEVLGSATTSAPAVSTGNINFSLSVTIKTQGTSSVNTSTDAATQSTPDNNKPVVPPSKAGATKNEAA